MIKLGTKVYRNIQEQVAKNTDDIAKLWRRPIFQIKVVEELPEEGEASTLYLLPVEDPEEGNYYEEYLWIDGAWELVGSTAVDISNMVTTDTDQTITGAKTIDNELTISNGVSWLKITNNGWTSTIQQQGGLGLDFGANALMPTTGSVKDLGANFAKWKDIYLSSSVKLYGTSTNYWEVYSDNEYDQIRIGYNGARYYSISTSFFSPSSSNTRDLGTSSYKWKNLYLSGNVNFNGIATMETASDRVTAKYGGSSVWEWGNNSYRVFTPLATAAVYPTSDGQKDIGLSSQRYKDLYLSGNFSDGTNSVSIADLIALITYAKTQGWIS